MKKVALLISFMLLFAFTSFAQVDVTFEGSSTLTLGISLDDPIATGFTNDNSAKLSFSLGDGTAEKGGEEDVCGYISFGDWKINYNTDDDAWDIYEGDITAKIMFSMGWVTISGTMDEFNFVNPVQDDDGDNDNDDKGLVLDLANSGGCVLGLDFAPLTIELGVFSENDWNQTSTVDVGAGFAWVDDGDGVAEDGEWVPVNATAAAPDDRNDENAYGAALKLTADIAPLKVEAGAIMGIGHSDESIGLAVKVTADISNLSVYGSGDIELVGSTKSLEFGAGVSLALMDGLSVSVDGSYGLEDVDDTDVRIKVTEDGAEGAIPGLGIALTAELFNMLGATNGGTNPDTDDDLEYAVAATVDYTTDMMKPYVGIRYGTFTHDDDHDTYTYVAAGEEPFKLNIGVELYLITDVVLTIDYNSDDLTSAAKSNGAITLMSKISY